LFSSETNNKNFKEEKQSFPIGFIQKSSGIIERKVTKEISGNDEKYKPILIVPKRLVQSILAKSF
jgi:hypothetical protein